MCKRKPSSYTHGKEIIINKILKDNDINISRSHRKKGDFVSSRILLKIYFVLYLDSTPSTQSSSSQQCAEMRTHRETVNIVRRLLKEIVLFKYGNCVFFLSINELHNTLRKKFIK